jgi:hypothetical protein
MDNPESVAAVKESQMVVTKEIPGPELVERFLDSPAENAPEEASELSPEIQDRSIGQAAQESVSKPQPAQAPEVVSKPVIQSDAAKFYEAQTGVRIPEDVEPNSSQAQNRAMEIIEKENFPTPPNYGDESAPQFPIDVSLCSRDELFSLHARFHAYETRMNWVLMQYDDEMNDYIKLRNYREAVVAKSVPFMGEDNKRNTNEHREAQVRGDDEVLELGLKEHEARKVVTDLKVLRNNFHLDCERLSRQMSKYEMEKSDAPR